MLVFLGEKPAAQILRLTCFSGNVPPGCMVARLGASRSGLQVILFCSLKASRTDGQDQFGSAMLSSSGADS